MNNIPPSLGRPIDEPTVARVRGAEDRSAEPSLLALITYAGEGLGTVFPLPEGDHRIGRAAECRLQLNDSEASRVHARLTVLGERATVEDLGSTNGTRVNERAIEGATELRPGDRLAIGAHILKLVVLDELEREFHRSLVEAGTRDPLTGLANRGAIMRELENRFGLSRRYGRPMGLVIVDLDHFKIVNDTRGHAAGDEVLRAFAATVAAQLREPDLAGRIGGEEFLLLLPETDLEGAAVVAERLRLAVASMVPGGAAQGLACTCSLGAAQAEGRDKSAGEVLARADAALYRAKGSGRNRVERD